MPNFSIEVSPSDDLIDVPRRIIVRGAHPGEPVRISTKFAAAPVTVRERQDDKNQASRDRAPSAVAVARVLARFGLSGSSLGSDKGQGERIW